MLPLLIYFCLKKISRAKFTGLAGILKKLIVKHTVISIITLLIIMLLVTCLSFGQYLQLNYKVMYKGEEIGRLKMEKIDSVNTSLLKLNSEIKKRIIILFSVIEKEEALFENGVLLSSFLYRRVNENVKANQRTSYAGNYYFVRKEKSSKDVMIDGIRYNQLSLYFSEPENIKQFYSDNYLCLINIEKINNHVYKIKLPDNNTNYYQYSEGVCTKVILDHKLFKIEFVLSQ